MDLEKIDIQRLSACFQLYFSKSSQRYEVETEIVERTRNLLVCNSEIVKHKTTQFGQNFEHSLLLYFFFIKNVRLFYTIPVDN